MRSCAEFFSDYELTLLARETLSPENQQIRDELWLTRNSKNRLCADSTNQEIPYTKYRDFKKIIKKTLPPYTLEDVHTIGPDYSKHEFAMDMKGYARGTAVQEDGGHTIAFGPKCPVRYNTVEECLPVIRLIRLGNSKPAPRIDEQPIEDWVELREFSLSADMDTQMKEKLDFPEDWNDYLKELNEFQQIYTDIRKDPGVFASYRFFNAMGGVVCLQDHLPKGFKGNGEWEDGGEEGSIIPGYALTSPYLKIFIMD